MTEPEPKPGEKPELGIDATARHYQGGLKAGTAMRRSGTAMRRYRGTRPPYRNLRQRIILDFPEIILDWASQPQPPNDPE